MRENVVCALNALGQLGQRDGRASLQGFLIQNGASCGILRDSRLEADKRSRGDHDGRRFLMSGG